MRLKTLAAGALTLAVLAGAPTAAQAAWPGADGLIAITEEVGRDTTVAVLDGNGTKTTLVASDGFDGLPTFDPTGAKLAYVRISRVGDSFVSQLRERSVTDAATDRLVLESEPGHVIGMPNYSADGTRISFPYMLLDNDPSSRVDSVRLDGTDRRTEIAGTFSLPAAAGPSGLYALQLAGDDGVKIVRATGDPDAPTSIPLAPRPELRVFDAAPSGQSILYGGLTADGECRERLFQAPAVGGTGTSVGNVACGERLGDVAAAPAGGRAAVIIRDAEGESSVRIATFATGAITPFADVEAGSIDWQPRWQATTLVAEPSYAKLLSPTGTSINLRLQARLTRGTVPVPGQQITFKNGAGGTLCTGTTGNDGVAGCTGVIPLLAHLLSVGYIAYYDGAVGLSPSSDRAPIIRVLTLNVL